MGRYNSLEAERVEMVDPTNQITPVMSWEHHKIHSGGMFTVSNKMDIGASKVGVLMLTVPAGTTVHLKTAEISSTGGPVIVNLLEDYSAVGTAPLPVYNRNRLSSKTPLMTVRGLADASAVAGTTPLSLDMLVIPASGAGTQRIGAKASADEELLLKPGIYLLALTNTAVATVTVGYTLNWYEGAVRV